MLRNLFYSLVLFFSIFSLSCSSDKVTIGFLMSDYVAARWQEDRKLFIKKVNELGAEVIVESAKGNPEKQLEQARALIEKGVNILVIVPADAEKSAQIVKEAHEAGIKVVAYDKMIKNCDLDFYISFDNEKVGELQADYLRKLKPKGTYAIIGGDPSDNNATLFHEGQIKVLKPSVNKGDIKLVYDKFSNWSVEAGYNSMKTILSENNHVDAVITSNDDLASGAVKALKEAGIAGEVMITGQDANLDACQRIIKGTQTMTVYKSLEAMAYTSAIVANALAKNEPISNFTKKVDNGKMKVTSVLLSPVVVNKANMKMIIISEGKYTEDQLNNE